MFISSNNIVFDTDYSEKFNIKGIHDELKIIVSKIDQICRENDIKYSIAYGTQLGAVRHGGFIPWDDDLDILMTRFNYNKFIKALNNDSNFNLQLIYDLWVERIIANSDTSIFVDVFILDNYPDNPLLASIKSLLCRAFQGTMKTNIVWSRYSLSKKILLFITKTVGSLLGKNNCLFLYHRAQKIGNKCDSQYLASYNGGYRDTNEPFEKSWFDNYIDIKFEDLTLMSNANFDTLLTQYYGDYMQLPPEDKRIPEHGRVD